MGFKPSLTAKFKIYIKVAINPCQKCVHAVTSLPLKYLLYQTGEPSESVYRNASECPHLNESFANHLYLDTFWCSIPSIATFSVLLGHFPNESFSPQLNRPQSLSVGKDVRSFCSYQAPGNLTQFTTVISNLKRSTCDHKQRYHHFILLPNYFLCFKVEADRANSKLSQ